MEKAAANVRSQFKFNLILIKFLWKKKTPKEFTWVRVKVCASVRASRRRRRGHARACMLFNSFVQHVYIVHLFMFRTCFSAKIHGVLHFPVLQIYSLLRSFWFALRMYTLSSGSINMIMATFNVKWKITIAKVKRNTHIHTNERERQLHTKKRSVGKPIHNSISLALSLLFVPLVFCCFVVCLVVGAGSCCFHFSDMYFVLVSGSIVCDLCTCTANKVYWGSLCTCLRTRYVYVCFGGLFYSLWGVGVCVCVSSSPEGMHGCWIFRWYWGLFISHRAKMFCIFSEPNALQIYENWINFHNFFFLFQSMGCHSFFPHLSYQWFVAMIIFFLFFCLVVTQRKTHGHSTVYIGAAANGKNQKRKV